MTIRKKIVATLITLGIVAAAGSAFAMWSATAAGSARAKALTAQQATVTAVTGAADLYPGYTAGDVHFTINNTNPYPVTFTSMTSGAVTSSNEAGCASSLITVANASGLSFTVPANSTSNTLTINDVVSMNSTAGDGCQGATFDVALTLAGSQS